MEQGSGYPVSFLEHVLAYLLIRVTYKLIRTPISGHRSERIDALFRLFMSGSNTVKDYAGSILEALLLYCIMYNTEAKSDQSMVSIVRKYAQWQERKSDADKD